MGWMKCGVVIVVVPEVLASANFRGDGVCWGWARKKKIEREEEKDFAPSGRGEIQRE